MRIVLLLLVNSLCHGEFVDKIANWRTVKLFAHNYEYNTGYDEIALMISNETELHRKDYCHGLLKSKDRRLIGDFLILTCSRVVCERDLAYDLLIDHIHCGKVLTVI